MMNFLKNSKGGGGGGVISHLKNFIADFLTYKKEIITFSQKNAIYNKCNKDALCDHLAQVLPLNLPHKFCSSDLASKQNR